MKYPFTPEVLDALPNNVVRIYRDLEIKLIQEICSRLALAGTANEVVLNDIRILRELGFSQAYIDKMIMEHTHLGRQALDKIYDDAVERNQAYYTDLISKADITKPSVDFSLARALEPVEMIRRQTQGEFENITRSIAFQMDVNGKPTLIKPGSIYYRILDDAEAQIKSGAISYQEAIRGAVKGFADGGVRAVEYASGHHDQIDVAVRRAVMTGISQLCDQYTVAAAEILETDYFEVSAHVGARDRGVGWQDHKSWQGKVYSIRTKDRYPNIYAVCGLGYVDGLEGANCRHRRFAFVEGVSERTYTDEQLKNMDPPPFSFEGKQYSIYEATQKQREIERTIRKLRREQAAYRSSGLTEDEKNASIRIRRLNQEYRAFSEAAGLPKQWERTKVQRTGSGAQLPNPAQSANGIVGSPSPVERIGQIDPTDENINQMISQYDKKWLGLDHEEALVITADGGVFHAVGKNSYVDTSELGERLKGAVDFHNHPDSKTYYSFSGQDVGYFLQMGHRESRAADRLYRYTMRRTPQTLPATSMEIVEAFEKIRKETVGELAWNGEINIDIDEYHETVLRLAKRYHFDYERVMRDADQ